MVRKEKSPGAARFRLENIHNIHYLLHTVDYVDSLPYSAGGGTDLTRNHPYISAVCWPTYFTSVSGHYTGWLSDARKLVRALVSRDLFRCALSPLPLNSSGCASTLLASLHFPITAIYLTPIRVTNIWSYPPNSDTKTYIHSCGQ